MAKSLPSFITGLLSVARLVPPGLRDSTLYLLTKTAHVPTELQEPLVKLIGGLVDGTLTPSEASERASKFAFEMQYKGRFM